MSSTLLEQTRALHEDLEVFEKAMYKELGNPSLTKMRRADEIARDQVVATLLDAHSQRAAQRTSSSNALMMQSATQARGAHCEVRQEEAGLRGAYFGFGSHINASERFLITRRRTDTGTETFHGNTFCTQTKKE